MEKKKINITITENYVNLKFKNCVENKQKDPLKVTLTISTAKAQTKGFEKLKQFTVSTYFTFAA